MPTEDELRALMQDGPHGPDRLDADRIIARARARRRPRQVLAGALGGLAVLAVAVPVSIGLGSGALPSASTGTAADGGSAEDSTLSGGAAGTGSAADGASAALLNLCGAPPADPAPDPSGLELTVTPVVASASAESIETTVTLTNAGDAPVRGTTGGSPVLTLVRDNTVLWHSNGPTTMIAVLVDLAPGESMNYPASFEPVRCGPEDETGAGFPSGLPAVGPGPYELSAAIDLVPEDGSPARLVTGPAAPVTLR